jgi:hypothetical protein
VSTRRRGSSMTATSNSSSSSSSSMKAWTLPCKGSQLLLGWGLTGELVWVSTHVRARP